MQARKWGAGGRPAFLAPPPRARRRSPRRHSPAAGTASATSVVMSGETRNKNRQGRSEEREDDKNNGLVCPPFFPAFFSQPLPTIDPIAPRHGNVQTRRAVTRKTGN